MIHRGLKLLIDRVLIITDLWFKPWFMNIKLCHATLKILFTSYSSTIDRNCYSILYFKLRIVLNPKHAEFGLPHSSLRNIRGLINEKPSSLVRNET